MNSPLISVIVPVYNVENVLHCCINSILEQSYKNIEIILVDDGSKDHSGEICDSYAKKYKNIRSFHKENGGQSSARNLGLIYAQGEYVGFIDSDDYIDKNMYTYLYNLIAKYEADVSSIAIKPVYKLGQSVEQPSEKLEIKDGSEILHHYMEITTKTDGYSVCRCLFKRELLSFYAFREGHFYEDIDYKFVALSHAKRFVDSNQIYYYYLQTQDSTSFAPFKPKDYDLVLASDILFDLCKKIGDDKLLYYAKIKKARTPFSLLFRIAYMGFADECYTKVEQKIIIKNFTSQLRASMGLLMRSPIKISRKAMAILLSINFHCVNIPLKAYHKIRNRNLIKK